MTTEQLIFLVFLAFASLCLPLTASGVLRWRASEKGPVQLMGQFSGGAGGLAIISAVAAFTGIYPQALFLMMFAISFGLGAWMLGAILDKSGYRLPDYVMLFWVAIAVTLLAVRAI